MPLPWGQPLGGYAPVAAGALVDLGGTEFRFEISRTLNSCFVVPTQDHTLVFNGTFKMNQQKTAGPYGSLGDNAKGAIIGGLVLGQGEDEWAFGSSGTLQYGQEDDSPVHLVQAGWEGTAAENRTTELRNVSVSMTCVFVPHIVMSDPEFAGGMDELLSDLNDDTMNNTYRP